jgi:hypothetical protein
VLVCSYVAHWEWFFFFTGLGHACCPEWERCVPCITRVLVCWWERCFHYFTTGLCSLHCSRASMLVREMLSLLYYWIVFLALLACWYACIVAHWACQKKNRHGFSTGGVRNKRDASLGLLAC